MIGVILATGLGAAAPLSLATAVKAAFLYKFGAFIDWPASGPVMSGGAAKLCVAGADPFDGALDQLTHGQQIAGRPIQVERMVVLDRSADCAILYAGGSARQPVADQLAQVRGLPVLTVTDEARDPAERGMINFVQQDGRVRFQINDQAASQAGLSISSKLLSLAVRPGGGS
jgi:hypothetical protein